MMKYSFCFIFTICAYFSIKAQNIEAIYVHYLPDNYFLVHPAMAGAGALSKIRLTTRKYWLTQENSPFFQTATYHGRIFDNNGVGVTIFNDQNGNTYQRGAYLTYAYHIESFGRRRRRRDLNLLSFGATVGIFETRIDESKFNDPNDPAINRGVNGLSYYNLDTGLAYNYKRFFAQLTVKNLLGIENKNALQVIDFFSDARILTSAGYIFGNQNKGFSYEPSFLFQHKVKFSEISFDTNIKVIYSYNPTFRVWGGISAQNALQSARTSKNIIFITPFVGVDYNKLFFSYVYGQFIGDINFSGGNFHQVGVGVNLQGKRTRKYYVKGIL